MIHLKTFHLALEPQFRQLSFSCALCQRPYRSRVPPLTGSRQRGPLKPRTGRAYCVEMPTSAQSCNPSIPTQAFRSAPDQNRSVFFTTVSRAVVTMMEAANSIRPAMVTLNLTLARMAAAFSGLYNACRWLGQLLIDNSPQSAPYCSEYIYNDRSTTGSWIGYSCGQEFATIFAWPVLGADIQTQAVFVTTRNFFF